ncbi:hypothetical protein amrb99_59110 [Actinomadura sp. RB99]|uniref:hypothetical protein n=1 Tax=Actinomadura sp. RB99 TaxID=2691577 RepID=UPI0016834B62|nr:hypothetical protein [Actinomadura sp. RB99]MBD2896958.1 hypothetical protein [Actinomadura sp. RB99]
MNLEQVVAMLDQIHTALRDSGMAAGDVLHSLVQVRDALDYSARGYATTINERIVTIMTPAEGEALRFSRVVDVVARRVGEIDVHIEEKTGSLERAFPTIAAAYRKGQENLQLLKDLVNGATGQVRNIWKFSGASIQESSAFLETRLTEWAIHLRDKFGATESEIRRAVESIRLEDAFGAAIEFTWEAKGPISAKALEAASRSPDFRPAMEVLFGPAGKLADAAHDAALGANLHNAGETFEKKVEDSVTAALDEAGTKASAHAAKSLGEQVASGVNALGAALTAVPQFYDSVTKLGEAWDRPLRSTKDYMDLLTAGGAVVSQAGQVLQTLSGITQIATAAQAVFNAVMAMNPIVLVVIAVVALIAAIALLIVYWDQVKAALRDNPWLAVIAVMLGVIGVIVVIIAYWDEIKLAVLIAANFVAVQAKQIGQYLLGIGTVAGQVWDWITATAENAGIALINAFVTAGTAIQNYFIGLINTLLEAYNAFAASAAGQAAGMTKAALLPKVDVQARLIPPKEVPQINVAAAFTPTPVTGGLEGQIAAQEAAVAKGRQEDEDRRAKQAAGAQSAVPPGAPGAPPTLGAAGPQAPAAPGAPEPPGRPALPPGPPAPPPAAAPADQSVRVEGGITVNINAERLEADAATLLSDEIVRAIQERLGALRSEQDFRTGSRAPAPA